MEVYRKKTLAEKTGLLEERKSTCISSDVKFYTMSDLKKLLGWSEVILRKLFDDPDFPSANYGRTKVIEGHALIDFFSRKHVKSKEPYWR